MFQLLFQSVIPPPDLNGDLMVVYFWEEAQKLTVHTTGCQTEVFVDP